MHFCFPGAKTDSFPGFSVHHSLQDGPWLRGRNNLHFSGADLGKGSSGALESGLVCGAPAGIGVGIWD